MPAPPSSHLTPALRHAGPHREPLWNIAPLTRGPKPAFGHFGPYSQMCQELASPTSMLTLDCDSQAHNQPPQDTALLISGPALALGPVQFCRQPPRDPAPPTRQGPATNCTRRQTDASLRRPTVAETLQPPMQRAPPGLIRILLLTREECAAIGCLLQKASSLRLGNITNYHIHRNKNRELGIMRQQRNMFQTKEIDKAPEEK